MADPVRRAALGRAARERATGFTWEAAAAAHQLAYDRAVGVER